MSLPHEQPHAKDGHTHYTIEEIYEWAVRAVINNNYIEDYIEKALAEDEE